jgi:membrane protease YdiL (CAAX protease family)
LTIHQLSPERRAIAVAEVVLAAGVVIGHNVYGVVPNEVLVLAGVGIASLALRKQSPRDIGMRRPASWSRTFLIALCAGVFLQLLSTYVTEPIISRVTGQASDLSQFRDAIGNIGVTAAWIAIAWTFAAFGEEFVYRGYILNRIAEVLGGRPGAFWTAVVLTAALFGVGHYYQGLTGIVDTSISALVFGGLYVWSGRNLWLPILAHGLTDTIAFVALFFGLVDV